MDKGQLLHPSSDQTAKQPLTDSTSANSNRSKKVSTQHKDDLSIAGALPDCLFTPEALGSKPHLGAESAAVLDENSPPNAAIISQSSQGNVQPIVRTQLAVGNTPTSIFRKLNTQSPADKSTGVTTERALAQMSGTSTENPSKSKSDVALSGLKRARPLQRGIHPADINKRITNAQECWHILEIVESFGADFDAVNVATALHRIAKQRPDDSQKLVASETFRQLVMMVDIQVMV